MGENEKLFTDGEAYEKRIGRWSRLVGETFLDWLAVPKGMRWLDVGCGNGAFTAVLIARCDPAAVSAIDPSEGMLSYARTRPDATLAEFHVGDAQALPYRDRSFDAATMALAISFIPDPLKAIAENEAHRTSRRLGSHLYVGPAWRRHSDRTDVPGPGVTWHCLFDTRR